MFPISSIQITTSPPCSQNCVWCPRNSVPDPEEIGFDEEDGLICHGRDQNGRIEIPLAEVEVKKKAPNHEPVSDYSYWFHNWR